MKEKSREILKTYIDTMEPVLEIGPFINPFIKREDYNVFYADINDKAGVYKVYENENYKSLGFSSQREFFEAITPIDFVISGTYKEAIKDICFQTIFSSHVIEHTVDIIEHITQVAECIEEGGYLLLAIPDKRYTFDHYREVTPFRDAIDIHLSGGKNRARFAFDQTCNGHHNNPVLYHDKTDYLMGKSVWKDRYKAARESYDAANAGQNFSGHTWVFTYASFLAFLRDGIGCGFFPFSLKFSSEPKYGENEMCIALEKNSKVLSSQAEKEKELTHIQRLLDEYEGIIVPTEWSSLECTRKIYIYGAGGCGRRALEELKNYNNIHITGFIVSDGQNKKDLFLDLPIMYLSEIIPIKEECIVIVASYAKEEITAHLEEYDIQYKVFK